MSMSLQSKSQQHFAGLTDVSLTCDIWTDRIAHAFLGVTVHSFVNGKAEPSLLAFMSLMGHTLAQELLKLWRPSLLTVILHPNPLYCDGQRC